MKPLALLAALGCAAAAVIWWPRGTPPATTGAGASGKSASAEKSGELAGAFERARAPDSSVSGSEQPTAKPGPGAAVTERDTRPTPEPESRRADVPGAWPSASARRTANAGAAPAAEPVVPVRLAFRALWYLGVDPEAERTWSRAINDPSSPPGVRSDLIVDMIDEGYSDNSNPTKADLPVILARLEIIERYAPYAMDQVNAEAFEEAYRHLLEMYVRLGGEPRTPR